MKTLYIIDDKEYLAPCGDDTVLRYDTMKFTVALQGLLNRNEPKMFILWQDADAFWLEYMSRPGKLLDGYEHIKIGSFDELLRLFADKIRSLGLVAWDYNVPATMNVATTVCGVEGLLPVRGDNSPGSVQSKVSEATGARVKLDLRGMFTGRGTIPGTGRPSSGSAKCDAYLWALDKYLDKTDPKLMFYTLDGISWAEDRPYYPDLGNAFVYNHDYAVARRAFVFDVSSYDDELPCDDPGQPLGTDYATMKEILRRQYERTGGREMITICGFNPWQRKYTTHGGRGKHGGVEAEWRFTEVISAYNFIKDADAYGYCGLANASLCRHYKLKDRYENRKPRPTAEYDPDKTYILFYVGDYDAAAWTYRFVPQWYRDKNLGKNPLMWCFNPNLSDRIPHVFDFIYENYTQNDYFQAGDSGAGYNNPRLLYPPRVHSDLPSGAEAYVKHNKHYFDKFDLHIVGFVINGVYSIDEAQMADIARFADVGVGHNSYGHPTKVVGNTVFMPHTADISAPGTTPDDAAKVALAHIDLCDKRKKFHIFRTILTSPTAHDEILAALRRARPEANFELVDPYTFFEFAKIAVSRGLTY
ncbi:MAG: hypothetical protein ACOYID_08265 [Eubacteriales bacterium]|jgi:hypothetical protein|nr:hypothetical protein [Clostridiales bacterium]